MHSAPTSEWTRRRALRARPTSTTTRCAASCTGTDPGDSVEVWFEGAQAQDAAESFTYKAVSETGPPGAGRGGRGLHGRLAGAGAGPALPATTTSTRWQANGVAADVYDVDARGRTAPDHLGVLSHYDARHLVHGRRRRHPQGRLGRGNADRLALDEIARVPRLHERGRPRALHRQARRPAVLRRRRSARSCTTRRARGRATRRPDRDRPAALPAAARSIRRRRDQRRARVLVRRATSRSPATGTTTTAASFDVNGIDDPFTGLTWGFNGPDSADNQDSSVVVRLDERHPAAGRVPAVRELAVGAVGQAGRAVRAAHRRRSTSTRRSPTSSYKRLTREIAVPAGGGNLTFWTSYDTEAALGLHVRGGPDGRRRRLDDAAGRQRPHHAGDRRELRRRAGASCTRTSTTTRRATADRDVHADRHDRRVERRVRQLRRLAAVDDRPVRLRRQDGRDLDRLRQRLVGPEPRRVRRRRRRCRTARARRSRPGLERLGGHRAAGGQRRRTRTTGSAPTPAGSPSAPRSPRRTRC